MISRLWISLEGKNRKYPFNLNRLVKTGVIIPLNNKEKGFRLNRGGTGEDSDDSDD
jgi:hypothetical protein